MAVKAEGARGGVQLVVEDYPYAADGLLLWELINEWTAGYVGLYYPSGVWAGGPPGQHGRVGRAVGGSGGRRGCERGDVLSSSSA